MKMDLAYIPALAAVSGSASGALATVLTGWMTQPRKDRRSTYFACDFST